MRTKTTAVVLILLAAAAFGEQPGAAQDGPGTTSAALAARVPTRSNPRARAAANADTSFDGRLQDMQNTLRQMHVLLEDMQNRMRPKAAPAKTVAAKSEPGQDLILTDNLRMWQLLLNHLDSTMAQARISAIRRGAAQRIVPQAPAAPMPTAADSAPASAPGSQGQ